MVEAHSSVQAHVHHMNEINIATRSPCRYKVAAFGYDERGRLVGYAYNTQRLSRKGGGNHAEINLLRKVGAKRICAIRIVRASRAGTRAARISVCPACLRVLERNGIAVM